MDDCVHLSGLISAWVDGSLDPETALRVAAHVARCRECEEQAGQEREVRELIAHRREALDYALKYARDMDVSLADQFVGMYVNDWTLDYGERGRAAVTKLLDEGHRAGIIPAPVRLEFVD